MTVDASRLQALFAAAIELPPEARDDMLVRECASDAALLAELRALLAADEKFRDTTAQPAVHRLDALVADALQASPLRGRRVGPWELRDELGSGGMGTVYRAERVDGTVKQTVAIKF